MHWKAKNCVTFYGSVCFNAVVWNGTRHICGVCLYPYLITVVARISKYRYTCHDFEVVYYTLGSINKEYTYKYI